LPEGGGRTAGARAAERLRRLLVIVPYLVRHPGTTLAEIARLFGVEEADLLEDLDRLFMSGLPPYGPGDLIGVDVEDGRVWIEMADYFSRPLRLSRPEAVALYLRGTAVAATPGLAEGSALASAVAKLGEAIGPGTLGELTARVESAGGGHPARALETLRDAVRRHERLRIEYYAQSSAETTERQIDPEEVFFAIGSWYVVAWDHRSDQERLFRADRIRSAVPTGESFDPRGLEGAGRPLYTASDRDVDVRLRLGPVARWVAEYYEVDEVSELEGGGLEVSLPATRLEWVARLLLRLGQDAEVIEPEVLKDRVRDLARRTRKRYLDSSPDTVAVR
jgi:proteasome accessory factor C